MPLHSVCQPSPCQVVQVYGALAKGFARSGDWRRAIEVINLMQCDQLEPNEQAGCAGEQGVARLGRLLFAAQCRLGSAWRAVIWPRLHVAPLPAAGVWQCD